MTKSIQICWLTRTKRDVDTFLLKGFMVLIVQVSILSKFVVAALAIGDFVDVQLQHSVLHYIDFI